MGDGGQWSRHAKMRNAVSNRKVCYLSTTACQREIVYAARMPGRTRFRVIRLQRHVHARWLVAARHPQLRGMLRALPSLAAIACRLIHPHAVCLRLDARGGDSRGAVRAGGGAEEWRSRAALFLLLRGVGGLGRGKRLCVLSQRRDLCYCIRPYLLTQTLFSAFPSLNLRPSHPAVSARLYKTPHAAYPWEVVDCVAARLSVETPALHPPCARPQLLLIPTARSISRKNCAYSEHFARSPPLAAIDFSSPDPPSEPRRSHQAPWFGDAACH